jgi:hypothetical protein
LPPSGDPAGAGRRRLGADGRRSSGYPAARTPRHPARRRIFTLNSHTARAVLKGPLNTLPHVSAPIAEEGSGMKRIAAIITLAFVVLAIPATAMASTSGSGTSGGNNGYVQVNPSGLIRVICPLSRGIYVKPGQAVKITYANGRVRAAYLKVDGKRVRFFCPIPWRLPRYLVRVCGRHFYLRHVTVRKHVYRVLGDTAVCRQVRL